MYGPLEAEYEFVLLHIELDVMVRHLGDDVLLLVGDEGLNLLTKKTPKTPQHKPSKKG